MCPADQQFCSNMGSLTLQTKTHLPLLLNVFPYSLPYSTQVKSPCFTVACKKFLRCFATNGINTTVLFPQFSLDTRLNWNRPSSTRTSFNSTTAFYRSLVTSGCEWPRLRTNHRPALGTLTPSVIALLGLSRHALVVEQYTQRLVYVI